MQRPASHGPFRFACNDLLVVLPEFARLSLLKPRHMLRSPLIPLLVLALFAGCAVGPTTFKFPISGGEMVPLSFAHGAVVPAENDDFKIETAQFEVSPGSKQGTYIFKFLSKKGAPPRSVRVEDVSDEAPVTWIEDTSPQLAAGHWHWQSGPVPPDRANLRWIFEIESCFRVYRFTIATADGRSLVMYEPCSYPDYVKTYFRQQLGVEQPPSEH